MNFHLNIELSEKLFIRNPVETDLGKKILKNSIILIHEIGIESFTFKKLSVLINTTEASIYRYFENKQFILLYLVDWFWAWQEYRIQYKTTNIDDNLKKLNIIMDILCTPVIDDESSPFIDEKLLFDIVVRDGTKTFLTTSVTAFNNSKLFKPYKDLSLSVAKIISAYRPKYQFPNSLASTIIELSHLQFFYEKNLPSLTDFNSKTKNYSVRSFIENIVFSSLK